MDQVTDDNRRLGKISQLGHEKIGFDATTTSTGREHVCIVRVVMYFLCSIFNVHCVDTTKSNVVSDTITSDEPASTDLSGILTHLHILYVYTYTYVLCTYTIDPVHTHYIHIAI